MWLHVDLPGSTACVVNFCIFSTVQVYIVISPFSLFSGDVISH